MRAALAIQDDVATFNSTRGGGASATPIVLNLRLHAGPCIPVTTGDVLDYFGATVNIAVRLERQCRGGKVIVSEAVAKDAETAATLANRTRLVETATLRGVIAPVRFLGSQSATSLTASARSIGSQRAPDFRRAIERAFGPLTAARSQTGPLFAHSGRLEST